MIVVRRAYDYTCEGMIAFMPQTSLLISIPRAARALGISPRVARQLVKAGAIPAVQVGMRSKVPSSYLVGVEQAAYRSCRPRAEAENGAA